MSLSCWAVSTSLKCSSSSSSSKRSYVTLTGQLSVCPYKKHKEPEATHRPDTYNLCQLNLIITSRCTRVTEALSANQTPLTTDISHAGSFITTTTSKTTTWHACDHTFHRQTITRSTATAEIARVGGPYTVQGHSRSLMLVPIESPYATFYRVGQKPDHF